MKNKSKKHFILLFFLTTIALSCIDEFTIPKTTATEYETEIVIEGRILAGEESMFHLTYTVPLNSEEEAPDILNAQVFVIGQNGFRSEAAEFNLEKDCYVIDTRALENNTHYAVEVTVDGDTFQSDFQPLLTSPEIDEVTWQQNEKYEYANANASLQWAHLFGDNFRMTTTAGYDINQYYLKMDFDHDRLENHRIDWGWKAMMYDINPGDVKPHGTQSLYMPKTLEKEQALEAALYLNEEWDITPQLTTSMGMRYSLFNAFGPRTIHTYREGELPSMLNVTGTETRDGNLKTWHGPEFRLGLRYAFTDNLSVKAGFNTMRQYIHKISNTLVMSATDTWKLSDIFIKPQTGVQYSLGLYRNGNSRTTRWTHHFGIAFCSNYTEQTPSTHCQQRLKASIDRT